MKTLLSVLVVAIVGCQSGSPTPPAAPTGAPPPAVAPGEPAPTQPPAAPNEACAKGKPASEGPKGDAFAEWCQNSVGEQCFESAADACACLGCPDSCEVLESFPTQIHCAK